MPNYLAAVGGGELIGFDGVFDGVAVVDDVGQTAGVATVGAYRYMSIVDHYVAGHPISGVVGRKSKLLGVLAEKDEQIAASAEVDI